MNIEIDSECVSYCFLLLNRRVAPRKNVDFIGKMTVSTVYGVGGWGSSQIMYLKGCLNSPCSLDFFWTKKNQNGKMAVTFLKLNIF